LTISCLTLRHFDKCYKKISSPPHVVEFRNR